MNFNNQFIIILIAFGLSFLSWLFKQLRERYAVKQARMMEERRREEALRTGRRADPRQAAADPGVQIQQETVAQRQAAERARREREQQAQRRGAPGRTMLGPAFPNPSVPIPRAPMRPATPVRRTPAQPPVVLGPGAQRRPAPQPPRQQATRPPRVRPAQRPPEPRQTATLSPVGRLIVEGQSTVTRLVEETSPQFASQPSVRRPAVRSLFADRQPSAAEWRRALLVSEVLAAPVSLRDEQAEGA